jgi:hypothetical protein
MGEKRSAYMILTGKSEGRRPFGRLRHWWEDTVKMDLKEMTWGGMYWIHLGQDRDQWQAPVNMVTNLWVQ